MSWQRDTRRRMNPALEKKNVNILYETYVHVHTHPLHRLTHSHTHIHIHIHTYYIKTPSCQVRYGGEVVPCPPLFTRVNEWAGAGRALSDINLSKKLIQKVSSTVIESEWSFVDKQNNTNILIISQKKTMTIF